MNPSNLSGGQASVPPEQLPGAAAQPHPPCSWRVAGAARPGVAHLKQGLPCQDAQAYRQFEQDGQPVLLIALADGAGSAEHSDLGAQLAVEAALHTMQESLSGCPASSEECEDLLRLAFHQARQVLQALAEQDELPLRSLATTLTCVAVWPDRLIVGQLGDGVVVAQMQETGTLTAVTQPQRGEYANETYFLTQEEAVEQVQIEMIPAAVKALAVMSDGLLRLALKLPSHEPHLPFFNPLFAFAAASEDPQAAAEQLGVFLDSERVCARTDDDKSLVLAVCHYAAIDSEPALEDLP